MGLIYSMVIPLDEYDYIGLPVVYAHHAREGGEVTFIRLNVLAFEDRGNLRNVSANAGLIEVRQRRYPIPSGADVYVQAGDRVEAGALLAEWDPSSQRIRALGSGQVTYTHNRKNMTKEDFAIDELNGCLRLYIDQFYEPLMVSVTRNGYAFQNHQVYGSILIDAGPGQAVNTGESILVLESLDRFQSDPDPALPTMEELKERFPGYQTVHKKVGLAQPHPSDLATTTYGLIKLMADLNVDAVLSNIPEETRARVLTVLREGYLFWIGGVAGEA